MRIPLWNGKHLVITLKIEPSLDQVLLGIIKARFKNYKNEWSIDRIRAITFYRSVTHLGLMESKNYIDNLVSKNNIPVVLQEWEYQYKGKE